MARTIDTGCNTYFSIQDCIIPEEGIDIDCYTYSMEEEIANYLYYHHPPEPIDGYKCKEEIPIQYHCVNYNNELIGFD